MVAVGSIAANNKILEVEGKPLRAYYELNHNPAKGETPESELRRWLLFLYTDHKIKYYYKDENDCFYFKSDFCMLDGIERVPTWAEMEKWPTPFDPTKDC